MDARRDTLSKLVEAHRRLDHKLNAVTRRRCGG
jgi:hypothetical protein